jgi:hypothetical protein
MAAVLRGALSSEPVASGLACVPGEVHGLEALDRGLEQRLILLDESLRLPVSYRAVISSIATWTLPPRLVIQTRK